jgi:hypothetical protein
MADKYSTLPLLKAAHRPPIVALDLPEDDDITDVEELIYVQIRGDFREFLLTASDLVLGSLEPVTVNDPSSHTYLPDVACDAWEAGLPRELLPICKTDLGYYCLDLEDQVIYWSNGKQDPGEWPSIWSWAESEWINS